MDGPPAEVHAVPRGPDGEDPARPGRARLPRGLAGALVLVVAVEVGFSAGAERFRGGQQWLWAHAARAAAGPEGRAEILCLGDSVVSGGVIPGVLSDRLGAPSYNLAVPGAPAPASHALLRRALRAGARPRVVLVDFQPNLLAVAPRSTPPSCWAELLTTREAVELAWGAGDFALAVETLLCQALSSYRLRDGVRAEVVAALRGGESEARGLTRGIARNVAMNRGACLEPERALPADSAAELARRPDRGRWKPAKVNAAYLRRFVALAESAGARVVWLWTPATPEWQARRRAIGADDAYERLVREVQAAHPGLVLLDGRGAGYGHDAFFEHSHLHARGAEAYSRALAEVLSGGLGDWVALPPYEAGSHPSSTEDLDASLMAVGASARRVRR